MLALTVIAKHYFKEAITWNFLCHPNVLPFCGVLKDSPRSGFVMVSEWMTNGDINKYVRGHLDMNRFKLVLFRVKSNLAQPPLKVILFL